MTDARVLSIQSHVVHGYVGGKAAIFPLQLLGFDVDAINTVHFSNHSGYGRFGGSKTTADELNTILRHLSSNGMLRPQRLLTGYVAGPDALAVIAETAQKLRSENPGMIYLLDPVMGDGGKIYVAPEVVPIYRSMLPLADIITPNYFEVELLTGIVLSDLSSFQNAIRELHVKFNVPNVVISSVPVTHALLSSIPEPIQASILSDDHTPGVVYAEDALLSITSSRRTSSDDPTPSDVHALLVRRIPGYFSGVGDLFSALVLAHYRPDRPQLADSQNPLSKASSIALSTLHAILVATQKHALALPEDERTETDDELDGVDPTRKVKRMRGRELRLVQEQDLIRAGSSEAWNGPHMVPWSDFW
ncbi:bud site selection protein 16 [Sistotremastrum suecicum HHB10207 ss-3]|uniref:pyridoxal kinase n=1 Tax=Sistotremastrum suecicum HHB10207 ss-3 TaxID=1314776 RepID=A0A166GK33_9AGAM|nr:bud site selection protein 16 [Sistotremastrum suecicum HHB10207 ss-3]